MEFSEISSITTLLRQYGDKILSGNFNLSLTTSLLQYINNAFCLIVDHDSNSSFQVIHTTTNAKLHDLHFLHDFIQKVEGLVITHGTTTLKGNVDISKFRNLRRLELRRVPLHMVSGLSVLQPRLKTVTASRSVGRLSEILGGEGETLTPAIWSELFKLSLPQNTLATLDASLRLAKFLKEVNLSHNHLNDVSELEVLPNLTVLNLSYNRLNSIPKLHPRASRSLKSLAMAHNRLDSLSGLESFTSLQVLHVGWNFLLEASSLAPLSRLPSLRRLWLEGNPLSRHANHREKTARRLHPCTSSSDQFCLDGEALNEQEKRWIGAACLGMSATLVQSVTEAVVPKQQHQAVPSTSNKHQNHLVASKETRRGQVRVREAVIADFEEPTTSLDINTSINSAINCGSLETSQEHLKTKREIETLREKLGDSWLGGVPGLLGLPAGANISVESNSFQHEARAWLDSQQRPPSHSPCIETSSPIITNVQAGLLDSSLRSEEPQKSDINQVKETVETTEVICQGPATDSGNEHEQNQVSEEEEDEDGSEAPYLVQRETLNALGEKITTDYFFIVGPNLLTEREASGKGKIVAKWPTDTLQSCEHPSQLQVTLTFDTVRRDKKIRNYFLDLDEVQRLCRSLGARLEARSLRDMNQAAFRCMKCSTQFSAEMPGVGIGAFTSELSRCPSCGSAVVVQEEVESVKDSPPKLLHSDSHSSIGVPSSTATGKVMVSAQVHPASSTIANNSQTSTNKSSAASLEQSMGDSGLGLTGGGKRHAEGGGDSDIEVLSNPSQSSIEILPVADETHSREQSVVPATEMGQNSSSSTQTKSPHGLTESSSSGSMTDSVCTAYESSHSNIPQPSSSLGSVLGSFFQRLAPPPPTKSGGGQPVLYNYSDFARVDHRLKLYLCMRVLNNDNEILTTLMRCWFVPPSCTGVYSGLVVLSSQDLYILRITGTESDAPETWLTNEGSCPLSQVTSILPTLWNYGINVTLEPSSGKLLNYTLVLGDMRHAPGFLSFITGLVPATCRLKRDDSENVLLPFIKEERAGFFAIASQCVTSIKLGNSYGPLAIAVSDSDVAITMSEFKFAHQTNNEENWWSVSKPITSVMELEVSSCAPWMLKIHFSDETEEEGSPDLWWSLWFVSQKTLSEVTQALKTPWKKIFEVPLDVRIV